MCCPVGCCDGRCTNQAGEAYDLHVKRSGRCGWGLFAGEPIPAGRRVCRYLGEVVNGEERDGRYVECIREALASGVFRCYMMQMRGGLACDARHKGSIGRFVNHSCAAANVVAEDWTFEHEHDTVVLVSTRPISAGEEILLDYRWECVGVDQACLCGAPPDRCIVNFNWRRKS